MRLVERLAVRAGLPLRYSQGFNPHPVLSLALPRPVGVATRDDLLVLALEGEVSSRDLLDRLNAQAPRGMRFLSAERMSSRKAPRPTKAFYEIELDVPRLDAVRLRLTELQPQAAWPAERTTISSRGQRSVSRAFDLRPLVEGIEIAEGLLRFTLVRKGDAWARPAEFLRMLGLEDPAILARVMRTGAEYEAPPPGAAQPPPEEPDDGPQTEAPEAEIPEDE
jgi:radical SAM-linked protein